MPTLERLLAGRHEVAAVVSQPDRPRGRGRKRSPSPVAAVALAQGVPLLRPARAGDSDFISELQSFAPDLGIVVAFGQFLPKRIRALPRLGYLVNAHASLLPRHRGASPIAHAILCGDARTGVCAMRVEKEMDAGPVCGVRETEIGTEENADALGTRLAEIAAELIADTVERAATGALDSPSSWQPQDDARATLAPRIEREDGRLDFAEDAEALARRVRALAPRPGAFAEWGRDSLRILGARALAGPADLPVGTVQIEADGEVRIATARGWLVPTRLQRAGARALDTAEFQRGHGLAAGDRLGTPNLG